MFRAQGTNRLARGIYGAIRDRSLSRPDNAVRDEFLSTRLVETPGCREAVQPTRLPRRHRDSRGVVETDLTERSEPGSDGAPQRDPP